MSAEHCPHHATARDEDRQPASTAGIAVAAAKVAPRDDAAPDEQRQRKDGEEYFVGRTIARRVKTTSAAAAGGVSGADTSK